ncbi:MAG TPA: RNA polymerase Rpb4 [Archaeoglobus sp.]|nr:RNA polymerase Rpb4 [Archaeoglobus sp.]
MFKEVKEFEHITISEAKEIMEKIAKERQKDAELLFETRRALKHLRTFAKLPPELARKAVDELVKLPQVGRKDLAVKLVDIFTRTPDEVRIIYAKERFTISSEQIEEILEILEKYRI